MSDTEVIYKNISHYNDNNKLIENYNNTFNKKIYKLVIFINWKYIIIKKLFEL